MEGRTVEVCGVSVLEDLSVRLAQDLEEVLVD